MDPERVSAKALFIGRNTCTGYERQRWSWLVAEGVSTLCLSLNASPKVAAIHCVPGNAGTARIATNHAVESSVETLVSLFRELQPDLVVVGPEAPLCDGLADACAEAGIACFGPVRPSLT